MLLCGLSCSALAFVWAFYRLCTHCLFFFGSIVWVFSKGVGDGEVPVDFVFFFQINFNKIIVISYYLLFTGKKQKKKKKSIICASWDPL